jgi:hypothetical protein
VSDGRPTHPPRQGHLAGVRLPSARTRIPARVCTTRRSTGTSKDAEAHLARTLRDRDWGPTPAVNSLRSSTAAGRRPSGGRWCRGSPAGVRRVRRPLSHTRRAPPPVDRNGLLPVASRRAPRAAGTGAIYGWEVPRRARGGAWLRGGGRAAARGAEAAPNDPANLQAGDRRAGRPLGHNRNSQPLVGCDGRLRPADRAPG